ncbi:MAG: hypothetical protein HXY36_01560 [Chloroflexi bacterium]|nr:hypothetical protein [Chloroflexota bacterium]
MRFLRVIYVMAIAALIIALVVAGVEAFYPDPSSWQGSEVHARNVFFVVLPLGMVFAVVGILIRHRLDIFGAGLILGGMGTMVYAIVPYDLDNVLRFLGIAVALAVLIFVGNRVFLSLRRS